MFTLGWGGGGGQGAMTGSDVGMGVGMMQPEPSKMWTPLALTDLDSKQLFNSLTKKSNFVFPIFCS